MKKNYLITLIFSFALVLSFGGYCFDMAHGADSTAMREVPATINGIDTVILLDYLSTLYNAQGGTGTTQTIQTTQSFTILQLRALYEATHPKQDCSDLSLSTLPPVMAGNETLNDARQVCTGLSVSYERSEEIYVNAHYQK